MEKKEIKAGDIYRRGGDFFKIVSNIEGEVKYTMMDKHKRLVVCRADLDHFIEKMDSYGYKLTNK